MLHQNASRAVQGRGATASCEIISKPLNGWLSSRIRKIALTPTAQTATRRRRLVTFSAANRLKLANMMMSQNARMAMKGAGIGAVAIPRTATGGFAPNRC